MGGEARLRNEAPDRERRAARVAAARLERDTRHPQRRSLAVALETFAPSQRLLVERHRPAEAALERRDRRVVFDAADDEPAFDAEEIERRHADHLHPLWLPRPDHPLPPVAPAPPSH